MEMQLEKNHWQPNKKFTRNGNVFSSGNGLFQKKTKNFELLNKPQN